MTENVGTRQRNTVFLAVTPLHAALLEWARRNPYGRVTIIFQDGQPVKLLAPTPDGLGQQSILMERVAREMGLLK